MAEWVVSERDGRLMVATGFARRLPDGTLEMTGKGVEWTMDYLRRADPAASPRKEQDG